MPPAQLSTEQIANCVSFGVALVYAGLCPHYDDVGVEPVTSSLLKLIGAEKNTQCVVISRIDAQTLDQHLYNWSVYLGPGVDPGSHNTRPATFIEQAGARLAWEYCCQAVGVMAAGNASQQQEPPEQAAQAAQAAQSLADS